MTDHAIDLMLKKLEEMAPGDSPAKIAILNQSIMNGWKGVFSLGEIDFSDILPQDQIEQQGKFFRDCQTNRSYLIEK